MNIFFLDRHPQECAKLHCDKHVLKMVIEYAQLMSTALHVQGIATTYKPTHQNHPCAVWVRSSNLHYDWLYALWFWLLNEYTFRYGKIHACTKLIPELGLHPEFGNSDSWEDPPQCMPEEYKSRDTVKAYRKYYQADKARFARWKHRVVPAFMQDVTVAQVREPHEKDRHEQDLADRSTRSA